MSTKGKKFSELVIELTETWMEWMAKNKLACSSNITYTLRRTYSKECEVLIDREYEIVSELDAFLKNKNG